MNTIKLLQYAKNQIANNIHKVILCLDNIMSHIILCVEKDDIMKFPHSYYLFKHIYCDSPKRIPQYS